MNNAKIKIIKKKYDEQGYVLIKNFFKKEYIKNVKMNLFEYLKKSKKIKSNRGMHFANNSELINSIHHLKWPYVKKFRKNKKTLKIVECLLEEKSKDFGAEVFAKPAKVGMKVPIHQDNFYWNIQNSLGLTVWVALDKSNRENGAIYYFKGSHKHGLFEHKNSFVPGSSQEVREKKVLKKFKKCLPTLNIGDILIHDCMVLHGSERNLSNKHRAGLTMRYITKSGKFNLKAKKKYEKNLKKQQA